ncbi:hypothetical protein BASA50_000029 [Batrachochytrium salamandrivorans]|uniref:Uncharacterized protein n=1 Tax=Batrachochytrium salamandrivorans TaxID=1357716 RepID=A0ABQ8EUS7_9FUNG|nr:hypothetical protein BASA60_002947 [Batrachochytrium salamandrivorans]KAH6586980.1 hypothetical protein BASA50_000029 [Batrachochytrium salamandrivorans]
MQFFYLLSFVAVVSNAAALPQPAEISDKHSSNVDIALASFLSARSYQPGLDSQKNSATLMSLERRADSDGASGGNGGKSGPPLLTPQDVKDIIASFFKDSDFTSANISSTIDRVKDGIVGFYKEGEKAEKEIGGTAGAMLKRYIDRYIFVTVALIGWMDKELNNILRVTRTTVGKAKSSELFKTFIAALIKSEELTDKKEREVTGAVLNILAKTGTVIENVNTINTLCVEIFNSRMALFTLLGSPLKDYESTKVLYGQISNVVTSLHKFVADQQSIHDGIIKALEPPPPK